MMVSIKDKVAELKDMVNDRQKTRGETFFFRHATQDKLMWGNNVELTEQMKIWRKQRKDGIIEIHDYNNHTKQIDGTDWHILVVQQTGGDLGPIDTLGFGFDNVFMVSGFIYCFKSIRNRDATYNNVWGSHNPIDYDTYTIIIYITFFVLI
jgi:hypothetical protein